MRNVSDGASYSLSILLVQRLALSHFALGLQARLTSELILFFLYLGYIALTSAIDDPRRSDRAGALIAIVGAVNVPIIYFSVKWWNTLHQGASVSLTQAPSMARIMLWGMLLMALAFWMYSIALVLYRVRTLILVRERHTEWVQQLEVRP